MGREEEQIKKEREEGANGGKTRRDS